MANPKEKSRLFAGNLLPATGEYQIDTVHTFAEFTAQHLIVGRSEDALTRSQAKSR